MCKHFAFLALAATFFIGSDTSSAGDLAATQQTYGQAKQQQLDSINSREWSMGEALGKTIEKVQSAKEDGEVESLFKAHLSGSADALKKLVDSAQSGNKKAQLYVGYILDNGIGVTQDSKSAAKYFNSAVEVSNARYDLGVLYYYGRGVKKNEERALELFRGAAADSNISQVYVFLSLYYLKKNSNQQSLRYAVQGANKGNVKCFYLLSRLYYQQGNYKLALEWAKKASEAAEPNAPAIMSLLYKDGKGIDRNKVLSAAWWMIYSNGQHNIKGNGSAEIASFDLTADELNQATSYSKNWILNHKGMKKIDYTHTIIFNSQ